MIPLSDLEFLRYDRQISIKGFDIKGQLYLKNASALIIGVGGLGCAAAQYLAAAGIGTLTLVDFDIVSESNLHRQILHTNSRVKQLKVDSAATVLQEINPYLHLRKIPEALEDDELYHETLNHTIVLDCSDNVATRLQINAACFRSKTPLVSAAAIRMEGLLTTFLYSKSSPCYYCLSCLFSDDDLTCVESGVMSPLVGMIGSMQAMEAIKVLADFGEPLSGKLLTIDAYTMAFNLLQFHKLSACPVCASAPIHA